MNRKSLRGFAFGVGLLGILGCTAQPPEEQQESKSTPEEQLEATDESVVSVESFESGQVEAAQDVEPGAEKTDPD